MIERLIERKEEIKKLLDSDTKFIETITSEELFQIVMLFVKDNELKLSIEKNAEQILARCTSDYDMYNCFTIICLKIFKIKQEAADSFLEQEIKSNFGKDSFLYLLKLIRVMQKDGIKSKEELFEIIINDMNNMPTYKSSKILFDLYIFPDFSLLLKTKYRVVATLLEAYQLYDSEIKSTQIINGSTVISKLLQGNNEQIAAKYLRGLLHEKQISTRYVKMIGGGGSCLVFRIGDMVIKIGEERNDKKIYINHRILASYLRKLECDENGVGQFWVEIMKYAHTGDVTEEERDELREDLYDQGLIWDDFKLANCGVLVDGDDNYYDGPIDYETVAGNIDIPIRREEFKKRKRRVVVIDNDHIRFNTLRSCK